jgi:hypothetical protein
MGCCCSCYPHIYVSYQKFLVLNDLGYLYIYKSEYPNVNFTILDTYRIYYDNKFVKVCVNLISNDTVELKLC